MSCGIERTRIRFLLLLTRYSLLVVLLLFSLSCGKKGPPTLKAYEKPEAPAGLSAAHREGQILITWSYPAGPKASLKGFHVFRSGNGDYEQIAFVGSDGSPYADRNFMVGSTYRYKVIARNLREIMSADSEVIAVTPRPLPSPPENVRFSIRPDSIELSWDGAGEGVCYNIYKKTGNGAYGDRPLNGEPICTPSFSDTALSPDRIVHYVVRAALKTEMRDEGSPSRELEVNPSDFVPSPPSDLRITEGENRTYLMWKESPEPWTRGYRIYRRTEGDAGFAMIGEVKLPSFVDTEGIGKKVVYRIRAFGPSGESGALEGEKD